MSENDVLPGPIKLHSKAATVYKRAMDDKFQADRGLGVLSAFALAASEENGRGHLVITAPTGGSAGVMPSLDHRHRFLTSSSGGAMLLPVPGRVMS